jgi:hypothetical protein
MSFLRSDENEMERRESKEKDQKLLEFCSAASDLDSMV